MLLIEFHIWLIDLKFKGEKRLKVHQIQDIHNANLLDRVSFMESEMKIKYIIKGASITTSDYGYHQISGNDFISIS
jgi:hypothetical protein